MKKSLLPAVLLALLFLSACGDESGLVSVSSARTVIITAYSFVPTGISAAPGDTVFFVNWDDDPHHILNQSDVGLFDDTGLFDSAPIGPDATGSVTIPDNALPGDVFYYYDGLFEDAMVTPTGAITVE